MSDASQGPGWWLASDGKWYPPELWTGPPLSGRPAAQGAPNAYPGQSRAQRVPTAGVQNPSFGYMPYASYGGPPAQRNNGLAVAALVCACAGFLLLVPAILGVIFGFVARSQIRQSSGRQGGDGLAVAGIIVGFAWIALFAILVVVGAAHNHNANGVVETTAFAIRG